MHKRCKDPKTNGYERYGAKGITVDPAWDTYETFIADMGPRPSPKHHLDRINSDGPYSNSNCQWITATENARKRSDVVLITWDGRTLPRSQWAKELGLSCSTFFSRLKNWGVERAFTTPHGVTGPKPKRS